MILNSPPAVHEQVHMGHPIRYCNSAATHCGSDEWSLQGAMDSEVLFFLKRSSTACLGGIGGNLGDILW